MRSPVPRVPRPPSSYGGSTVPFYSNYGGIRGTQPRVGKTGELRGTRGSLGGEIGFESGPGTRQILGCQPVYPPCPPFSPVSSPVSPVVPRLAPRSPVFPRVPRMPAGAAGIRGRGIPSRGGSPVYGGGGRGAGDGGVPLPRFMSNGGAHPPTSGCGIPASS